VKHFASISKSLNCKIQKNLSQNDFHGHQQSLILIEGFERKFTWLFRRLYQF